MRAGLHCKLTRLLPHTVWAEDVLRTEHVVLSCKDRILDKRSSCW